MGFRNDIQRGQVCGTLTAWIAGGPWFIADGAGIARPTQAAVNVFFGKGPLGQLNAAQRAMLQIACCLFTGKRVLEGDVVSAMFQEFDRRNQRMLGELLVALADDGEPGAAVDRWLVRYDLLEDASHFGRA